MLEQSVAQNVKIDNTTYIDNCLALGLNGLESNFTDAEGYANKVLELDINNGMAWFIRGYVATSGVRRGLEARNYLEKAGKFMTAEEKKIHSTKMIYSVCNCVLRLKNIGLGLPPNVLRPEQFPDIKEDAKALMTALLYGLDRGAVRSFYRDWSRCLSDTYAKEKDVQSQIIVLMMAGYTAELAALCEDDCKNLQTDYDTALKVYRVLRPHMIYSSSLLRPTSTPIDLPIDLLEQKQAILAKILRSADDESTDAAEQYWAENLQQRESINAAVLAGEIVYADGKKKMFGGEPMKAEGLRAITAAFTELAFPLRK
ncbi:MAG: hypothetical protein LBV63_00685 [Candidatus Methanoplasma sp.]|jgi:hypothetical protein|nr:hypothetical protein [Candidatus Methanoplasma sp.]